MGYSGADIRQLLLSMRTRLGERGLGEKVEKAWLYWARDFLLAHPDRNPGQLGADDIQRHVESRARARQVSQAVQHQMIRACVFMLRDVLGSDSPELAMLWQSTRSTPQPVILAPGQVQALLAELDGPSWLMASLSYGAGLRLRECVRLRVRDIKDHRIVVCDASGRVLRETVLPERVRDPLRAHLEGLKIRHIRELADGFGGVQLPLNSAVPAASGRSWAWQFLFPGPYMSDSGGPDAQALRTHTSPTEIRQAIEQAARMAEIDRPMSENILRNSFAAHLLQRGVDMTDVERLLGVGPGDRSQRVQETERSRSATGMERSVAGF